MPTITATTIVSATADEAFAFVADYRNIVRLQPHFSSARLLSAEEHGVGAEIDLSGHFHGIPIKARNRIVAYSPPDRQVSVSDGQVLSRSTWVFEQVTADPPVTRVTLTLDQPFRAITPGQSGVLYDAADRVLGGGVIGKQGE